jgi:Protein of unknown function (DUF2939)
MRALVVCLFALTLSACATVQRYDAANDVHALLLAIRDNDQAVFDSRVDRGALKREIQAKLMARAGDRESTRSLAQAFAPALAELAGEALVQPEVFRLIAEHYGYTRGSKIPGPVVIARSLKNLPDGRICATRRKDGPCILTFTQQEGHWRLTGFSGDLSDLRL